MKSLVIIESPYAGDVKRNEEYAKKCMHDSLMRGEAPFLSHALYTQCLNDTIPEDRKMGMEAGWEWIKVSDFTAVYEDYGVSNGMKQGIEIAKKMGHKVVTRYLDPLKQLFLTSEIMAPKSLTTKSE